LKSTMQDAQLTIGSIMRHGTSVHSDAEVVTATADGTRTRSYTDVGRRAAQLAHGLRGLGIDSDQRVATFMWNNAEHLEAYLAVPSMGAVLHTLNIRLFPEQLVYIANHAEDRVVIVDDSLVPLLAKELPKLETVTHVLVSGPDAADADLEALRESGKEVLLYEDVLSGRPETFDWPEIDERDAAAMCYTSGTTGNPKGVVYSHRSVWLHSQAVSTGNVSGVDCHDRILPIVPMFHANAWGLAYSALMTGASLCMPDRWLQAEPMVRFIQASRPTVSGAVPTVWNDVLLYLDEHPDVKLDSLRFILCGGSAVPVSLQQALQERHGIYVRQAWGMTETSPVASAGTVPIGVEGDDVWKYRGSQGRVMCGVEARIVGDDGTTLPRDGVSVGELEVRGPWVTARYYEPDDRGDEAGSETGNETGKEAGEDKFHEGWLRTGDVGTLDPLGYIALSDRAKDVIKSGGEWISSVDLENALMGHPDVVEAAVVGIPDEKWQERPLATVVVREGASVTPEQLREHLSQSFAKWQLPDAWTFVDHVPRTSVGKFDKKVVRKGFAEGRYDVRRVDG
jgi:fatty-acyl-CoA synthase